jgi:hypothetical protein
MVGKHNGKRHSPISLEVIWATKQWEKLVFTFLLAIKEVNIMLCATYFYNKTTISMLQFRKELSQELIYNNLLIADKENEAKRVTKASKDLANELVKIPRKMKAKGSRMVKTAMDYSQYKCIGCKKKVQTYCKCYLGVIYCPEHYAKQIADINI